MASALYTFFARGGGFTNLLTMYTLGTKDADIVVLPPLIHLIQVDITGVTPITIYTYIIRIIYFETENFQTLVDHGA